MMYQGTTPTLKLRIPGHDLSETKMYFTLEEKASKSGFTLSSNDESMVVELDDEDTLVLIYMTQEQTLSLLGECGIQLRWIYPSGKAGITKIRNLNVSRSLLKDVINYD